MRRHSTIQASYASSQGLKALLRYEYGTGRRFIPWGRAILNNTDPRDTRIIWDRDDNLGVYDTECHGCDLGIE